MAFNEHDDNGLEEMVQLENISIAISFLSAPTAPS